MVHFLYAYSTNIAMTGSGRSIDVTGEAKFNPAYFDCLGDDVADLDMTFYVLIFGYGEIVILCFVFLVLSGECSTIF